MSVLLDEQHTAHRPWPVPRRPWALRMRWHDLLFLHWPVDPAVLRPHIPDGLEIDTFDGSAWLGVVPFRMSGVRPRFVPAVPGVSAFPELNVRTYVTTQGRPGVWFFSLDVTNRLAVLLARGLFHLPYFRARMRMQHEGDRIAYSSARDERGATYEFAAAYRGLGSVFRSEPGSIDSWLTERYCLYSANRHGVIFRGEIHHEPWPLERAEFEVSRNTLPEAIGVSTGSTEPLAHFARDLDVVAWRIRSIG